MTVRELIDLLRDYPADLRVVVDGYEDGYDDLTPIQFDVVEIVLDSGKEDWVGDHLDRAYIRSDALDPDAEFSKALVLHRTSH